jgi:hypothetical protein
MYEFAASLTSNVIANLSAAPLQLQAEEHRLRYDLGCSLSVLNRPAEAFAQAQAINTDRGGEPLELKIELLQIIAKALKFHVTRPPAPCVKTPIARSRCSWSCRSGARKCYWHQQTRGRCSTLLRCFAGWGRQSSLLKAFRFTLGHYK